MSQNLNDLNFSFSLKGKAFYMISLHPKSYRLARKAPYCTVVFNLHLQFEKLREVGKYHSVRNRIRMRDQELQSSINSVLRGFGEQSESKQIGGRQIENNWNCSFH